MNVGVIIQARMTSQRLPGKVTMELDGKPVLQHVVERAKKAKLPGKVVVASPEGAEHDVLGEIASSAGAEFFRGSEHDVLERFVNCLEKHKLDVVVRVGADCPLLSAELIDALVEKHLESGADHTVFNPEKVSLGLCSEVVNADALRKSAALSKDAQDREHVTRFIMSNKGIFKCQIIDPPKGKEWFPGLKLSLDTEQDLHRIREFMEGKGSRTGSGKRSGLEGKSIVGNRRGAEIE